MDGSHLAWRIQRHIETASTNTLATAAAAAGEPEGLVVVADHQTAGRGRLQRRWLAPPGTAVLMSVLLRPPPPLVHLAVTAVGCAAAAACDAAAGFEPGLKWPNDLVVGRRKLAGILAEAVTAEGNVTGVVVGLGLNVHRPSDRPAEIANIATDVDEWATNPVTTEAVLDAILAQLGQRYPLRPEELMAEYRARCVTIGQEVSVQQATGTIRGRATDVDDSGALLVETEVATVIRVEVGDVVHLRPG